MCFNASSIVGLIEDDWFNWSLELLISLEFRVIGLGRI